MEHDVDPWKQRNITTYIFIDTEKQMNNKYERN